jgi:hypothetical protein
MIGDHLLSRDFGPCGIILINVSVVRTVAKVMLFSDFGPYVFNLYVGWWSLAVKGF